MENNVKNPIEEKRDRQEQYYPYSWINDESLQFLYDKLGQKALNDILDEFAGIIEFKVEDIIENKGCGFTDWISEIKDRMNDGEFQNESKEEICKKLIEEMCNIF